ncbi:MAG: hypothetical protein ACOX3A_09635 [bacterium]|jgi:hypothetical protein
MQWAGIIGLWDNHPKVKGAMTMENKRSERIREIVNFVAMHRESHASGIVCREMLGDYYVPFNNGTREQLEAKLAEAEESQFNYCYYLVK